MSDNFNLTKITNDIYLITEPWNKEGCNIYLFKNEDRALIFDAGLGLFSLKNFAKNIGLNNFSVLLTHAHFDHFGGLNDFTQSECLIPSKITQNLLNKKNWGLEYLKLENFDNTLLKNITKKTAQEIYSKFKIPSLKIIPISTDKIKWSNYCFEIINLGGHTDDSCIYYEHQHKILITGDLLYDGEIYDKCYSSNKKNFLKALDYIKSLDFNLVLPGHNQVLNHNEAMLIIDKWQLKLLK